jgi:hypothetical protein
MTCNCCKHFIKLHICNVLRSVQKSYRIFLFSSVSALKKWNIPNSWNLSNGCYTLSKLVACAFLFVHWCSKITAKIACAFLFVHLCSKITAKIFLQVKLVICHYVCREDSSDRWMPRVYWRSLFCCHLCLESCQYL